MIKKNKMTFKGYYNQLSTVQAETRDDIIKLLEIDYATFYRKLKNNSFKQLEKEAIANYLEQPIHILFPESKKTV